MWPARGQGIVVLTNGVSGQLLDEIQAAFHQMYAIDKAPKKHTPVALDPRVLDAYVGRYQVARNVTLLVTREGNALFIRPTGQPIFEIAAESDRRFFPTTFEAQITFETDASGRATALIIDENGCSPRATRLDDATAKQVADAEAAFAKRFKDQTAAPGSEAALRRMIEELRLGKPNYDLMSSGLADATRQQLTQIRATLAPLGALQSLTFKGVGPGGADIYTAKFENGTLEYRIWLAADGKIDSANYRPPPAP